MSDPLGQSFIKPVSRSNNDIIFFDGLTKRYGNLKAVDGLTFGVPKGSLFGFLGANGAGKSTTLKMLLGLIRPNAGTFYLFGEKGLGRPRLRKDLGALIEYPAFYDHLSGRANLEIFARMGGCCDRAQIDELLDAVGLAQAARKKTGAYSQGMRQRLGVAQAMLGSPRLLVLDEPTNGLDPEGSREIWTLLRRQVSERGVTILISSHLLHEVEEGCDQLAIIDRGKLVRYDTVSNLLRGGAARVAVEFVDAKTARRARECIPRWQGVALDKDALADAAQTKVVVLLSDMTAAAFNQRLTQEGLAFHFIQPADRTLKDYFLAIRDKAGRETPR
ncbi:MAG: ABC transporter ATP-binding protein [Candidatus Sumerlaeota bacterium]|nr:ABC transporter ATP-binding protein [Candidatus Sumerlaeota bacterium]